MKRGIYLSLLFLVLIGCESSIKADFDTIKAKNVILIGDDGKEYQLQVKLDSNKVPQLIIEANK